jgi:hypothetical protein
MSAMTKDSETVEILLYDWEILGCMIGRLILDVARNQKIRQGNKDYMIGTGDH